MSRMPFAFVLVGVALLAACSGTEPASPEAPNSAMPAPPRVSVPTELTAEEAAKNIPPAPVALVATRIGGGAVHVSWEPAPAATTPHTYRDAVIAYRIYRGTAPSELAPVAEVRPESWHDETPLRDSVVWYAVQAVHAGNVEGVRSDAVKASRG